MSELEALNLLVQAAELAHLTKQEHVQIEQAGQLLYKKLVPKEDVKAKTDGKTSKTGG